MRRASGVAAATALIALAGFSGAQPAWANDGVCGSGDVCLYEDTSWSGGRWDDSGSVHNFTNERWWGTSRSINDAASSTENKYSWAIATLWEHSYNRGSKVSFGPGIRIGNLSDYGMNNKASSNWWG
ncbi:peptidase inhibitor family I36 protein [Micromonospora sp. NPDC126480]|uniref:peptidase inhibitor family I36 protein n=1 Tax=Micromonospora sp. NPDC126480 TaxID=3155312 RepID=UPI003326F3AC